MKKPGRVYIVLVNWNGWQDTIECLESVFRLDYPNFTVVVCDNASSDDSPAQIKSWAAGTTVVRAKNPALAVLVEPAIIKPVEWVEYDRVIAEAGGNPEIDARLVLIQTGGNLGFAGGNNVGMRFALAHDDCTHVWLLNNDTVVPTDSLTHLVARGATCAEVGMIGSTVLFYGKPDTVQALGGAQYSRLGASVSPIGLMSSSATVALQSGNVEASLSYVFGASMLVTRRFLLSVGLMTEDYFLFFEELDWAQRGASRGFRLGFAPASVVYHKAGASTGSADETEFAVYFMTRNRLLFIRRFSPLYLPINYPLLWLEVIKALMRRRWGKAKAIACGLLGIPMFHVPALPAS